MNLESLELHASYSSFFDDQLPGFKSCFGGEELNRAIAALTGDVVGGTIRFNFSNDITPSTAKLSSLSLARQPSGSQAPSIPTPNTPSTMRAPHQKLDGPQLLQSLQHKDLVSASKMYAEAALKAGTAPATYNLHYSRGLVLQELASKADPAAAEHRAYLEQACEAYEAACTARPSAPAALYNYGVALSDLARVIKAVGAAGAPAQTPSSPRAAAATASVPGGAAGPSSPRADGGGGGGGATSSPQKAAEGGGGGAAGGGASTPAPARSSYAGAAGGPGEARRCLALASEKYCEALRCQPSNPQALNNWGLVLQEVSLDAETMAERDRLVGFALEKFRCAIRMRPDFDRGCYNLGTVCYSYACTLQNELMAQYRGIQLASLDAEGQALRQAGENDIRTSFATAAQYICLAFALAPGRDVYRRSRSLVRSMLPLPFLRAGFLVAALPASPSASCSDEAWRRDWFVLDHVSLRAASGLEGALSSATASAAAALPAASPSSPTRSTSLALRNAAPAAPADGAAGAGSSTLVTLPLSDIAAVRRCSDPTLPPGFAIWLELHSKPLGVYLVAEDEEAADVWTDCLLLTSHIVQARGEEVLAEALSPAHS